MHEGLYIGLSFFLSVEIACFCAYFLEGATWICNVNQFGYWSGFVGGLVDHRDKIMR